MRRNGRKRYTILARSCGMSVIVSVPGDQEGEDENATVLMELATDSPAVSTTR